MNSCEKGLLDDFKFRRNQPTYQLRRTKGEKPVLTVPIIFRCSKSMSKTWDGVRIVDPWYHWSEKSFFGLLTTTTSESCLLAWLGGLGTFSSAQSTISINSHNIDGPIRLILSSLKNDANAMIANAKVRRLTFGKTVQALTELLASSVLLGNSFERLQSHLRPPRDVANLYAYLLKVLCL